MTEEKKGSGIRGGAYNYAMKFLEEHDTFTSSEFIQYIVGLGLTLPYAYNLLQALRVQGSIELVGRKGRNTVYRVRRTQTLSKENQEKVDEEKVNEG